MMAKIESENIVITVSRLVKDDAPEAHIVTGEITAALEQVAQELLGTGVIVEVQVA
jgi:hypothetical protein